MLSVSMRELAQGRRSRLPVPHPQHVKDDSALVPPERDGTATGIECDPTHLDRSQMSMLTYPLPLLGGTARTSDRNRDL